MDKPDILILAGLLHSRYQQSGENVMISCPFAPFSPAHKSGLDSTPSLGIKINPDGKSLVNCLACGVSGTLSRVFYQLLRNGQITYEVYAFVKEKEGTTLKNLMDRIHMGGRPPTTTKIEEVSYYDVMRRSVMSFQEDRGGDAYYFSRGVRPAEIAKFHLGYDFFRNRVTFPILSRKGELLSCIGRTTVSGVKPKYYKYILSPTPPDVLMGEEYLDPSLGDIILVEGPFDFVRTMRIHQNVLCLCGDALSDKCLENMLYWARSVTLIMDSDPAGRAAMNKLGRRLSKRIRVFVVVLPGDSDPDEYSEAELFTFYKSRRLIYI